MTYVVVSDDPDSFGLNGQPPARFDLLREFDPDGFPLSTAAPDGSLIYVSLSGTDGTVPGLEFFVGDKDRCLTQPDFPTLAQLTQYRPDPLPLAIAPGSHSLTLHRGDQSTDPFTFKCDNPPLYGPIDLDIAAGERAYIFLYAQPGDVTLRHLVVPLGR